jgi:hypothetical protein
VPPYVPYPPRVPTKAGCEYLGATSSVQRSQAGAPVALKGAAVPPCGALNHPAAVRSAGATERPRRASSSRPTASPNDVPPPPCPYPSSLSRSPTGPSRPSPEQAAAAAAPPWLPVRRLPAAFPHRPSAQIKP